MQSSATRRPRSTEAALEQKEELILAVLGVLDRTWTDAERPGALRQISEFFRKLDEPTLRAIAYQHGVFEPELDVEDDQAPEESHGQSA